MLNWEKQCKGKDLSKIPASKLLSTGWYTSIKADGHFVTVTKTNKAVLCHTSSGKPFHLKQLTKLLNPTGCSAVDRYIAGSDFILEVELTHRDTQLKKGGRRKAAITTTFRTRFAKGLDNPEDLEDNVLLFIHDIRYWKDANGTEIKPTAPFVDRLPVLEVWRTFVAFHGLEDSQRLSLQVANWFDAGTVNKCVKLAKTVVKLGYEGIYMKHKSHQLLAGKRVNTAAKVKPYPTVDLTIIDWNQGEGKHRHRMGSLQCKDENGLEVSVGGGFKDWEREWDYVWEHFSKGTVIECKYESLADTYVQPVFLEIHGEKTDG